MGFGAVAELWEEKRYAEAMKRLGRFRRITPELLGWRVCLHLAMSERASAEEALRELLKLGPQRRSKPPFALAEIINQLPETTRRSLYPELGDYWEQLHRMGANQGISAALVREMTLLSHEFRDEFAMHMRPRLRRLQISTNDDQAMRLMDELPISFWPDGFLSGRARTTRSLVDLRVWLSEIERRLRDDEISEFSKERLEETRKVALERSAQLNERIQVNHRPHPFYRKAANLLPDSERVAHAGGPPPVLTEREYGQLLGWLRGALTQLVAKMTFADRIKLKASGQQREGTSPKQEVKQRIGVLVSAALTISPEEGARFLEALDQKMMVLEFERELQRSGGPGDVFSGRDPVIKFRGQTSNGRVGAWMLEIDGQFVLLARLKERWRKVEGSVDDILASVPEVWFDGALQAMLGS